MRRLRRLWRGKSIVTEGLKSRDVCEVELKGNDRFMVYSICQTASSQVGAESKSRLQTKGRYGIHRIALPYLQARATKESEPREARRRRLCLGRPVR
jgi:hypothetical protein